MSEVTDAVQVVMLCGRGAMLVGNISMKMAMQIAKLMNTVYLAKWEGSVSLNRLRQIKGDDFVFINVASEKKEDLAAVEKEMKSHGILYARMPDLCGGDARTQYAIASSDAVKMKAMLLDHSVGPSSHIRVGPISESDYMMTGKKADGTDTKEMEELKRSAQETVKASAKKEPDKTAPPDREQEKSSRKERAEERLKRKQKEAPEKVQKDPEKDISSPKRTAAKVPAGAASFEEQKLRDAVSDVRIRSMDCQRQQGSDSVFWIKQRPVYENRYYAQFMMPDGKNSIFIRQEDILPGRDAKTGARMAAVFSDQKYSMMNMQKVDVTAADGSKAIAMFKLPGGAVVAQGSQQPDRTRERPGMEKGEPHPEKAKESRVPEQHRR